MQYSDALYQLIKSLNRTEKSYIKKFSHKVGSEKTKVFLELFDAIDKQSEYNEKTLISKFEKKGVPKKSFPAAKHYLYNLILKSLVDYNRNKSVHSRIRNYLEQAEILKAKRLKDQSLKLVLKAKELAKQHESMTHFFEILRVEQQLKVKQDPAFMEEQRKEERYYIELYENRYEFRQLYYKIFTEFRKVNVMRDIESVNRLKELMKHDLLSHESKAISFQAKNNFHSLHGNFYAVTGQNELAFQARLDQLNLWRNNKNKVESQPVTYLRVSHNVCEAALKIQRVDEARDIIKELEKIEPLNKDHQLEILEVSWLNKIKIAIAANDFDLAQNLVDELEEFWKQNPQMEFGDDMRYSLLVYFAGICYWNKQYDRSLSYQLELINRKDYRYQQDIAVSIRIINLFTYYELKNVKMLEKAFISTYRFLHKQGKLFEFEKMLISGMKKLAGTPLNSTKGQKVLKQLEEKLTQLKQDPFEQHAFQHFDPTPWIQSKRNKNQGQTV